MTPEPAYWYMLRVNSDAAVTMRVTSVMPKPKLRGGIANHLAGSQDVHL